MTDQEDGSNGEIIIESTTVEIETVVDDSPASEDNTLPSDYPSADDQDFPDVSQSSNVPSFVSPGEPEPFDPFSALDNAESDIIGSSTIKTEDQSDDPIGESEESLGAVTDEAEEAQPREDEVEEQPEKDDAEEQPEEDKQKEAQPEEESDIEIKTFTEEEPDFSVPRPKPTKRTGNSLLSAIAIAIFVIVAVAVAIAFPILKNQVIDKTNHQSASSQN